MKIKKKNGGASRRKALKPLYHKIKKSQERVFNQVRTLTLTTDYSPPTASNTSSVSACKSTLTKPN